MSSRTSGAHPLDTTTLYDAARSHRPRKQSYALGLIPLRRRCAGEHSCDGLDVDEQFILGGHLGKGSQRGLDLGVRARV
jgi:hypothetical protein